VRDIKYFLNFLKVSWLIVCLALVFVCPDPTAAENQLKKQLQNLQIITEEYPPISFTNKAGEIDGLAVDVVKEIMKRLGINQKIEVLPWARAYKEAVKGPNFVLFSVGRTRQRESLFNWVGSMFEMKSSFYAKKGSEIKISNLENAKKLASIGTYRDSYDEQFLKEKGFKNLDSVRNNVLNIKKLMADRLEVFTATNTTISSMLKRAGYSINDVERVFTFLKVGNFIVFSKQIPPGIVNLWQQEFENIRDEGLLAKIRKKWLP
jgi:polar amino acid transport system substrate-binding protein